MKICKHCDREINTEQGYYISKHTTLCENCGDKDLIFNGGLDLCVYKDHYQDYYSDEELKRLETFEWIQEDNKESEIHLLEDSSVYRFLTIEVCNDETFEVYIDDYGQSFHLA